MATVLNRTTKRVLSSVNTPDYPVADWVINPDLSGVSGVSSRYWKINADDTVSEMSQAEKDAAWLSTVKSERIGLFKQQVTVYIADRYDASQQVTLLALWDEGQDKSWVARKSRVQSVVDWVNSVLDHFYAQKNVVVAATTIPDVEAVALDLAQFDAADPGETVEAVKAEVA